MPTVLRARRAFGQPGIAPRWTRSAKDAVGTAYAASSRVWFTVSRGAVNEVYYPTVATAAGIEFADVIGPADQQAPIRFTFRWPSSDTWEGRDFSVAVARDV